MNPDITYVTLDQAWLVQRITQDAFAEYGDQLNPPPACQSETLADVRRALQSGGAVLAWWDGAAVGAARYTRCADHLYVGRVAVLPGYRGCGIASAMLAELETLAAALDYDQLQLRTRLNLPRNIALYQRLGYVIVQREPIAPGADVQVTMRKRLSQPAPEMA